MRNTLNMKNFLPIFTLLSLLLISACGDDDNGGVLQPTSDVKVTFSATYGDQDFEPNAVYNYENGTPIQFSRFQFFISDFAFAQGSDCDTWTEVDDVELITFDNDNSNANEYVWNTTNIPVGDYTCVKFGVGVTSELNATKPNEYGSTHPLYNTAEYWAAWESYIFAKIEGRANVDDSNPDFEKSMVYHLGSDVSFREVTLTKDFTMNENNTLELNINVDLKRILVRNKDDFFNIAEAEAIHENGELVTYLMDNFMRAIDIQ